MIGSPRRIAAAVAIACAASATAARAQVPEQPPPDELAVELGVLKFWPFFEGSVERSSNVFQVSDAESLDVRATTITTASPGFLLELPFSRSWARVGWVGNYRDYGVDDIETRWSNYFKGALHLRFSNGVVVDGGADLQRGILDARAIDPGGGVTFRGQQIRQDTAQVAVGHERPDRTLLLRLSRLKQDTIGENPAGLFDIDEDRVEATGDHRRSPRLWISWDAAVRQADLERDSTIGTERKTTRGLIARAGGSGRFSAAGTWSLRGGWASFDFGGPTDTRYDGLSLSGSLERHIEGRPILRARVLREPYPILGGDGDYYVSNQVGVDVEMPRESRLVAGGALTYYGNVYPAFDRRDRLVDAEGWIGWRLRDWAEGRVFVQGTRRRSDEPLAEFDDYRIGMRFRIGG